MSRFTVAFFSPAWSLAMALLAVTLCAGPARGQFGLLFSAAGPVNRGMGGVGVATANDAIGALYWNPATISDLGGTQAALGVELLHPQSRLASTFAAGSLGPGVPFVPLSGSDRADNGTFPLPSGALVYQTADSPWTFGIAAFEVGGFGVNYPASTTNPVLTPQPPRGVGLGSVFSRLEVLEIAPAVSCRLTENLAVAVGPTLDLADLQVDPLFIAPPDDANGDGFPTFPGGTHTRWQWGGGVQGGVYYASEGGWRMGASVKSPRWFETFRFQSTDELGRPRTFTFGADLPMVISLGSAYAGFNRWLLGADLHYIDFRDAKGLGESGFTPDGAARGVGQHSIWAFAAGAEYRLTDMLSLRLGYAFSQNPIDALHVSANVASPTIVQHTLSVGASCRVSDCLRLDVAYVHGFQNSATGPLVTPLGVVPGTAITSVVSADTFAVGATLRFGATCD